MSQGEKITTEYQLPTGVLAALRQKPSTGQRPFSVQRSMAYPSRQSPTDINLVSRSHQNLHILGCTKHLMDIEERTVIRPRTNEKITDGVSAGKFSKHRATHSSFENERSKVTQYDTSVTSQKLAEQVAVVLRNPLMTSFNSSPIQKSSGLSVSKTPKHTGTRFGYLLSDLTTSREVDVSANSSSDHHTPRGNTSEIRRIVVSGKSTSAVIRKVTEEVEAEGLLRTEIIAEDSKKFDPAAHLTKGCDKLKRLSRRYREEIEQVSIVTNELQLIIEKNKLEKLRLREKKDLLEQKMFEVKDIEFIRDSRFAELDRIKKKLCNSILESSKDASRGYLSQTGLFQRSILPDSELLAMKCSLHMVDQNDLESQLLLQRCQLLLTGFKNQNLD